MSPGDQNTPSVGVSSKVVQKSLVAVGARANEEESNGSVPVVVSPVGTPVLASDVVYYEIVVSSETTDVNLATDSGHPRGIVIAKRCNVPGLPQTRVSKQNYLRERSHVWSWPDLRPGNFTFSPAASGTGSGVWTRNPPSSTQDPDPGFSKNGMFL